MSTEPTRTSAIWEAITERVGARPVHLVVFVLAVVGLVALKGSSSGRTLVPAVAHADPIRHPSPAATYVEEVFVQPGDEVEAGTPLLVLSSRLLRQELDLLDTRIERVHREAEMSLARVAWQHLSNELTLQARLEDARRRRTHAAAGRERSQRLAGGAEEVHQRLLARLGDRLARLGDVEEAEWTRDVMAAEAEEAEKRQAAEGASVAEVSAELEVLPELLALSEPVLTYYEASLRELYVERNNLLETLGRLTVVSRGPGRVAEVLPMGASAAPGATVAVVVPAQATELVAYASPGTNPRELQIGTAVSIQAAGCMLEGLLLRTGAEVVQAPEQLQTRIFTPVRGLPLHVSLPETCSLGVGQVGSVELVGQRSRREGSDAPGE